MTNVKVTYNNPDKIVKQCTEKYAVCLHFVSHPVRSLKETPVFMLSRYWIKAGVPKLIGYSNQKYYVYKVCYSELKNSLFLLREYEWEYQEYFGDKKTGWKTILLNDIFEYFNVSIVFNKDPDTDIETVSRVFEEVADVGVYLRKKWKLIIDINPEFKSVEKAERGEEEPDKYMALLTKVDEIGHPYGVNYFRYYDSPQEAFEKMMKFADEEGLLLKDKKESKEENKK